MDSGMTFYALSAAIQGLHKLRDEFAGQVVAGFMAREGKVDVDYEADLAYKVADAMLRSKFKEVK